MAFKLSKASRAALKGVHPKLIKFVEYAIANTTIDFKVLEGLRSKAQQAKNVAKGVSWTMNSKHLTGRAVDLIPLVNGKPTWAWPVYYKLAPQLKAAARAVGVKVKWGGDWKKNKDGPHWELDPSEK